MRVNKSYVDREAVPNVWSADWEGATTKLSSSSTVSDGYAVVAGFLWDRVACSHYYGSITMMYYMASEQECIIWTYPKQMRPIICCFCMLRCRTETFCSESLFFSENTWFGIIYIDTTGNMAFVDTTLRYHNAASGSGLEFSLPRIAIRPITTRRDVIHKTGSS